MKKTFFVLSVLGTGVVSFAQDNQQLNNDMGRIAARDMTGNTTPAALPVMQNFVPDAVMAKAKSVYGAKIYAVTQINSAAGETYQVTVIENGEAKSEWMNAEGTAVAVANIYRTEPIEGTATTTEANTSNGTNTNNSTNKTGNTEATSVKVESAATTDSSNTQTNNNSTNVNSNLNTNTNSNLNTNANTNVNNATNNNTGSVKDSTRNNTRMNMTSDSTNKTNTNTGSGTTNPMNSNNNTGTKADTSTKSGVKRDSTINKATNSNGTRPKENQ